MDKLLDDIRNQVNAITKPFPYKRTGHNASVMNHQFSGVWVVSGPRTDDELQPIAKQLNKYRRRIRASRRYQIGEPAHSN
ncbi:hypothetical protein O9993_03225 [Vibrio lentus]|nr:hypothetical protein [Vibrio lentus]